MRTKVEISEFCELVTEILCKNKLTSFEASIIVEHLLDGELSNKPSHGFIRIPKIVKDLQKNVLSDIKIEKESQNSALLNGGNRTGLIVAQKAVEVAIQKTKEAGISIVGGHSTTGTVGAIGHYTRVIAEQNLVGIMICNSENAIAPTGGYSLLFGTNPITIGIPTLNEPIVIDFATSKMAFGDIMIAIQEGKRLPEGIILDKNGNTTTDPNDAWEGPLLPIAAHKGYGLALAIELLAGPLVRAKAGATAVPGSDGFTIIAIDPKIFVGIDDFKLQVDSMLKEIKNSNRLPSVDEIYIPGERSNRQRKKNKNATSINLPEKLVSDIKQLN